jgi:CBS domain-containing protein
VKKLRDIMRPGFLFTVPRSATVQAAVSVMAENNVGIVSVLEGDRLVGVFSERDVVQRVVARGVDPARAAVESVMTTDLVVADADDDYQSAMRKMDRANIRHLPVVSEGRLLSMLSIRDLMRVHIDEQTEEIRYLQEYLYQVPTDVPGPQR